MGAVRLQKEQRERHKMLTPSISPHIHKHGYWLQGITPPVPPVAPGAYPGQQPYPPQGYPPQGYPPQQGYAPQQGYPPQQAYPPQQPYPPQGYAPVTGYPAK